MPNISINRNFNIVCYSAGMSLFEFLLHSPYEMCSFASISHLQQIERQL
jgi:hypothetical protein